MFSEPESAEYPPDHAVRLQHWHPDVSQEIVDGDFTEAVEPSLQLFLEQEQILEGIGSRKGGNVSSE